MGPDLGLYHSMNPSMARVGEYWCLGMVLFLLIQYAALRWLPLTSSWPAEVPSPEVQARHRRLGCRAHLLALVAFVAFLPVGTWGIRRLQHPVSTWIAGDPGIFVSLYGSVRDYAGIGFAGLMALVVVAIWYSRFARSDEAAAWVEVTRAKRFDHPLLVPVLYALVPLGFLLWGADAMTWGVRIQPEALSVREFWAPIVFPQWRLHVPFSEVAFAVRVDPGGKMGAFENKGAWPVWFLRTRADKGVIIDMAQAQDPAFPQVLESFLARDGIIRSAAGRGQVTSVPWKSRPAEVAP